ncbi:unnamed protein product [Moneuplotes crassus]|uniref:Sulfotransferase domain-containing protein n=1 Tax=Euplotes crassus TaxID=5936 RepID=A0AAD1UG63_EUPCR|nr:unnamed protein product [Moneuplotes crassus]
MDLKTNCTELSDSSCDFLASELICDHFVETNERSEEVKTEHGRDSREKTSKRASKLKDNTTKRNRNTKAYRGRDQPTYETYLQESKEAPKFLNSPKFLSKNVFEKVAIPSYQSSGSTLLRKYIENITCILTGSDGCHKSHNKRLKHVGRLNGEGISNKKVWLVQTSFPEQIGDARIDINKAIVVVRNPCDAIYSHFNRLINKDLSRKISPIEMEEYKESWEKFVDQEISVWREFHDYWMLEPTIPTLIVRHEDLIDKPKRVLNSVFKFLLGSNLEDTLVSHLIEKATEEEKQEDYKQNEPGYSFPYYSEEQISIMKSKAGCVIRRLGFSDKKESLESNIAITNFFEEDKLFEEAKEYEKDIIVKGRKEYQVCMRYDYFFLNSLQTSLVMSEETKMLASERKSFQINSEAESIRMKTGWTYKPSNPFKPKRM